MKPIEFIFYIIAHFVQLEPGRLATLKEQASKWETEELQKEGFLSKILKQGSQWYIQVFLAVALIFTIKSISNYLTSTPEIDTEEDTEEMPIFNAKTKKFVIQ